MNSMESVAGFLFCETTALEVGKNSNEIGTRNEQPATRGKDHFRYQL